MDANQDAASREFDAGPHAAVSGWQRRDCVRRGWQGGHVQLDREGTPGKGLGAAGQDRAGTGEAILGEDQRTEPGAANLAGGTLEAGGDTIGAERPATALCAPVHG